MNNLKSPNSIQKFIKVNSIWYPIIKKKRKFVKEAISKDIYMCAYRWKEKEDQLEP